MIHLKFCEFSECLSVPSDYFHRFFHHFVDFVPESDDGIKIVNQSKSTFNTLHKHNHISKCVTNIQNKNSLITIDQTNEMNTMTCNVYVYVTEYMYKCDPSTFNIHTVTYYQKERRKIW